MAVMDAVSSLSRGELAPQPNTFQQPGAYKNNPDTAMTDGVPKAMLKAQQELEQHLVNPNSVRKHLAQHHRVDGGPNPVQVHSQQHIASVMNQGHAYTGGQLVHGPSNSSLTTDIGAGTSSFASEAPPMIELRAVRSPRGVAFYHKDIGTPLGGENQYVAQKAANAAADKAEDLAKAEARATGSHQDLLDARRAARAKYPAGYPERLKAERAVRASRQTADYRGAKGEQAHVSDRKKKVEAGKDPGFYSPGGGGGRSSPETRKTDRHGFEIVTPGELRRRGITEPGPKKEPLTSIGEQQKELNTLTPAERSRYHTIRATGVQHNTAMTVIRRSQLPFKGTMTLANGKTYTRSWDRLPKNWKSVLQGLASFDEELVGAKFSMARGK